MADLEVKTVEQIKKDIRDFIINNFLFGSEDDPFNDDDSFLENGIIDSTGVLELINYIEETYNMHCEDDELIPENLDSVNNVANYVVKKTNK